MKKTFWSLALAALVLLLCPIPAAAQYADSIDLTVVVLNQDKGLGRDLSVRLVQDGGAGDNAQSKGLDKLCTTVFSGVPVEQFTLQVLGEDGTEGPGTAISLFRADKTVILGEGEVTDISLSEDQSGLCLGFLISAAGELKLCNIAAETAGVFSARESAGKSNDAGKVDVKFNLKDGEGEAINTVSLRVDERDALPANGDGEIYLPALAAGTHTLTAYSGSGAQIAESYVTISREAETGLAAQNPSNPTVSVAAGLDRVYVQADITDDLVMIGRVSPLPIAPGSKPLDVVFAVKGRLLDGAGAPLPSVRISLGDYAAATNNDGFFWLSALPADQYRVTAQDASGKTIASSVLLVKKSDATGVRDVSMDSATLAVTANAGIVYLTMQLAEDGALAVTAASEDNLFALQPPSAATRSAAAPSASGAGLSSAAGPVSYFSIYTYLFLSILVLIIFVVTMIIKAAFSGRKTKH